MSAASPRVWLLAARPKTLPACIAPVIMGAAMAWADGVFHAPAALAAALGALFIQVGTNFANDYFDFVKGTDTAERVGPTRATQAGLVSPETMRRAMVVAFALAFLPGAYLMWRGGLPIVAIGLVSVACGVLYTGGPYPLGYLGLGDLFVLVFFGPVAVAGTYYVQAQVFDWTPVVAGLAPGLLSTAILCVNNLRDADGDVKTGKRTLAVRFGKTFARWEYVACILGACVGVPIALWHGFGADHPTLLAMAALPAAIAPTRAVFTRDGAALNDTLAATGKVLVIFSALFALGWMI